MKWLYSVNEHSRARMKEHQLLFAVLQRGLLDALGVGQYGLQKMRTSCFSDEAENWVLSDSHKPMSICWICDYLELDIKEIRGWYYKYRDNPELRPSSVKPTKVNQYV